ncbi:MAG: DUF6069 family protein [Candidatus Dormiibacterota bacterium]
MATTITIDSATPTTARTGRIRALGVLGAAVAAVAVWAIAVRLFGVQLSVRFGSGAPQIVGIDYVVAASLVGSLLGWGFLTVLERRTSRARGIWTGVAVALLLGSLSLPLTAATTMSSRISLALMHLAVAAVLIPALRRLPTPPRFASPGSGR